MSENRKSENSTSNLLDLQVLRLEDKIDNTKKSIDTLNKLFFWFGGMIVTVMLTSIIGFYTIYAIHETKPMHEGSNVTMAEIKTTLNYLIEEINQLKRRIN